VRGHNVGKSRSVGLVDQNRAGIEAGHQAAIDSQAGACDECGSGKEQV
jgi:hypothetical protein